MKNNITILMLAVFFSFGCGTRKLLVAGIDGSKMPDISTEASPKKHFSIEASNLKKEMPAVSQIVPSGRFMIVLPFFAFYKKHFTCSPSAKSFEKLPDNMKTAFSKEMKSAAFPEDLASGYTLKLTIEELKFNFEYMNKGTIIIPVFFEIRIKNEYMSPMYFSLKVSYELSKDGTVLKKGTVLKEKKITEKISSKIPLPSGPMYVQNPAYFPGSHQSEGHYNTAKDYQQVLGGTYSEAQHAMSYGFIETFNLMEEVSKEIWRDIQDLVK